MATQSSKQAAQKRREELERRRAEQARAERKRRILFGTGTGVLVAAVVGGLVWLGVSKNHTTNSASAMNTTNAAADNSGDTTPANALAPVWSKLTGQTVDGVTANTSEQLAYHIHAHLDIYINGKQKLIPYGIGIVGPWATQQTSDGPFVDSGSAFYYLHTHDATGVIHIESPTQSTYSLGQFFAEWDQPLSSTQVGPDKGSLIVYVDGQKYTGDPAAIPLTAHKVIQLDLNGDVPFQPYTFAQGL